MVFHNVEGAIRAVEQNFNTISVEFHFKLIRLTLKSPWSLSEQFVVDINEYLFVLWMNMAHVFSNKHCKIYTDGKMPSR